MTQSPPVRWGFLGAGFVASRALAPAVHDAGGAVLQAVAARDRGRAERLRPARVSADYRAVCEADDVDVVYVALPNDAHLPWVLIALACGKHVLCEKPLGLDAAQVSRMIGAAQESGSLLVEAAWTRWHPRTRRLLDLVADLPGPITVESRFTFRLARDDGYRWRTRHGGGALLDVGPYAVGTALAALGRGSAVDATVVTATATRDDGTGVDVTTTADLTHAEDRARVVVSFDAPESQGFVVGSASGSLELVAPAFTSWREESVLRAIADGAARDERFPAVDAYRLMVEAVSARATGDPSAWVLPPAESLVVAAVLDTIRRGLPPDRPAGEHGPIALGGITGAP